MSTPSNYRPVARKRKRAARLSKPQKERLANPYKQEVKQKTKFSWKKVNIILVSAIMLLGVYFLFYSPLLAVTEITFEGPTYDTGSIEATIQEQLEKRNVVWIRNNILTFKTATVEQAFTKHPYLSSVVVQKTFPKTLAVSYALREPYFVVANQTTFWTADIDGYVLSITDTRSAQGPLIQDPFNIYQVGDQVIYAQYLKDFDLIWQTTEQSLREWSIQPEQLVLTQNPSEIELYTNEGWKVIFNLEDSIKRQLEVLGQVVEGSIEDRSTIQYIDLRVSDWVYYK